VLRILKKRKKKKGVRKGSHKGTGFTMKVEVGVSRALDYLRVQGEARASEREREKVSPAGCLSQNDRLPS